MHQEGPRQTIFFKCYRPGGETHFLVLVQTLIKALLNSYFWIETFVSHSIWANRNKKINIDLIIIIYSHH